jgi:hypothetical protein
MSDLDPDVRDRAAQLAQQFHEAYERLAPEFGYETREASAKPWSEVPENNRALMTAVCAGVLAAEQSVRQLTEVAKIAYERDALQARVAELRQANARLYEALEELVEAPLRSPEHEDRARAVLAGMTTELAGWQTP